MKRKRERLGEYALSLPQVRMLRSIDEGDGPFGHIFGAAQSGAAPQTLRSLIRRGLVTLDHELTPAGRKALR